MCRYEAHHKLRYTDEALMAAAKYSSQYISDRFLPDKVGQRAGLSGWRLVIEAARAAGARFCWLSDPRTHAWARCWIGGSHVVLELGPVISCAVTSP